MSDHRPSATSPHSLRRPPLPRLGLACCLVLASTAIHAATPKTALVMAWNIDAISTFDPAQVGEVVTGEILQNTCDSLADFDPADERKVIPLFAESWIAPQTVDFPARNCHNQTDPLPGPGGTGVFRLLVLLCHKRRRFVCRVQQGQRERFRAMATISLRRIVAIEFGM